MSLIKNSSLMGMVNEILIVGGAHSLSNFFLKKPMVVCNNNMPFTLSVTKTIVSRIDMMLTPLVWF